VLQIFKEQGCLALLVCVLVQGHSAVLNLLLQHQLVTDVNVADESGVTALHLAAAAGRLEAVQALLEAGADVDVCSSSALATPLHFAVASGIISAAVMPSAEELPGCQLQLQAVKSCSSSTAAAADTVAVLLDAGADTDAQDASGWQPLHWAVARGCPATAKLLLKQQQTAAAGSSSSSSSRRAVAVTRAERWSLLHLAVLMKDERMVQLLLQQPDCQVKPVKVSWWAAAAAVLGSSGASPP
jgi:ankyrin repeat protein